MPIKDPEKRRIYAREYRKKNIEKARATLLENKRKMREETRRIREESVCIDCRVMYPYYVLDFDHRPNEKKLGNIAQLINTLDWKLLRAEMAKCDIVCANCHRVRTQSRKQWKVPPVGRQTVSKTVGA